MSAEHLIQDWLDRCYIALERAKDVEREELAERYQERVMGIENPDDADRWIEAYYGQPLAELGLVDLPKISWKNKVQRQAYTKVWQHNNKIVEG